VIDAVTTLGKVDILSATALSIATTSLLPKPLNIAGFYLIADSLIDNLNTYIEDSDSVIAELLKIPTYYLYKTASIRFIDTNIISNVKVNTTNAASLVT